MIPAPTDGCWKRALQSDSDLSSAKLATKILLTRLRRDVRRDPESLTEKVFELHSFFSQNTAAIGDIAIFRGDRF